MDVDQPVTRNDWEDLRIELEREIRDMDTVEGREIIANRINAEQDEIVRGRGRRLNQRGIDRVVQQEIDELYERLRAVEMYMGDESNFPISEQPDQIIDGEDEDEDEDEDEVVTYVIDREPVRRRNQVLSEIEIPSEYDTPRFVPTSPIGPPPDWPSFDPIS